MATADPPISVPLAYLPRLSQISVPLACLPRLADIANLLSMSFGSASLLLLLGLNVWRSKAKKTHWIPSDTLVLGALSLQLVGLLSSPTVKISDSRKLDEKSVENMFVLIRENLFLTISGRAVMCVFIGNMLPDVARSLNRNVWSEMLALAISATGVLIHLSYEIYIFLIHGIWWWDFAFYLFSYVLSNITIFISIMLLVLLLGCAALASNSIHDVVAHRVPLLLSRSEYQSVLSWEAVEEQAVRSWIIARTYQPQYIIARSVLTSSVGFLVTISVAFCLLSTISIRISEDGFIMSEDGLDWLRYIALAVQWTFIILGWGIVSWRWVTAVVFYPRRMGKNTLNLQQYFIVEDFWKRGMIELQEEFMELDVESKSLSLFKRFILMFIQKFRLYKLFSALLCLQILLVFISKACWMISEIVFSNHYMRRVLMGSLSHEFLKLYNMYNDGLVEHINHGGFIKYLDALMHMPGENPAGVWIANKKSVEEIKAQMRKGELHGQNCKKLISLLGKLPRTTTCIDPFAISCKRKLEVEGDFKVGKSSTKMTTVSLLTVMIELNAFYQEYGMSLAYPTTDTNHWIEAFSEAWGIMELVDNLDPEASLVSKHADRLFNSLKKSRKWLDVALPINNFEIKTVETAKEALHGLENIGKQTTKGGCISGTGYDSKNWKAIIAGNNLYKTCQNIKSLYSDNIEDTLDGIQSSLADIIRSCLFKLGEIIVDERRLWAGAFMEEKLWDAFYEVGKAKGLTQGIKFERHGDKILCYSKSI